MPSPPAFPRGERIYQNPKGYPLRQGGPGIQPDWFPGSTPEWYLFWGCWPVFGLTGSARDRQFERGYPDVFAYQDPFEGGRIGGAGGQVFDFVFYPSRFGPGRIVRVQTEQWHYQAEAEKQVNDAILLTRAAVHYPVTDVFDFDIMQDPTGAQVIKTLKRALAGELFDNPITSGVTRRGGY
jgi:hypothetical protein